MSERKPADKLRVIVVGSGVAALETILGLQQLAPDAVSMTVIAPDDEFTVRPMAVREPFAYAPARRYPVASIVRDAGAVFAPGQLAAVDPATKTLQTTARQEFTYDALVLAIGARPSPRFAHAVTIDDHKMDELLHGMIQDIEDDYIHSVVFLAPERMAWPLPLYELALMTAERAHDMGIALTTTVVTPELRPLAAFGAAVSNGVEGLLREARVDVIAGAHADVPRRGEVTVHPGQLQLLADRVIALPELFGPAVAGVPHDGYGFIPVDNHGRVPGTASVYAAGDGADFPIKHGGLASQQADAVAQSIAASAGARITPQPLDPILRGVLLTGRKPRYLYAHLVGGHALDSEFTETPTWSPTSKLAAHYLSPYLELRDGPQECGNVSVT